MCIRDRDGDGYGDNRYGSNGDPFPNDHTQFRDIDSDGYGDNISGNNPDAFPADGTQWNDTDQDGYGDNEGGTKEMPVQKYLELQPLIGMAA